MRRASSGRSPPSFRRRTHFLAPSSAATQDRRVTAYLRVGLSVLVLAGCTPPLEPAWLVTAPRELAIDVEVVVQGPYGDRLVAGSRSARDALPLDTLRLRPALVDADGPIDPDGLESAWFMCEGIGSCLLQGTLVDRPTCTGEEIQPSEPCRFADEGTARLTIADLPSTLPADPPTVFDLVEGPTVSFVASGPDGPGLDACLTRFDARERLDGCLAMERALGLGPLGELVDLLQALGIDPGIGDEAETLLTRPRNHNPAVERFRVEVGGEEPIVVAAGGVVSVPRNEAVVVTVETSAEDLDAYEVAVGDETAVLADELDAQWWLDREVELDDTPYGQLWVRWRPGAVVGTVRTYVVLRDGRGGEAWGWLDLEIQG